MTQRWDEARVIALAPHTSSERAGRQQAAPARWSQVGAGQEPPAVWGLCQGSGKNPYRTVIDLSGPAYSCSCPSRKFPCKHALGLLLLWSQGDVADSVEVPGFAAQWLDTRAEKAAQKADSGSSRAEAGDPAAGDAALKRAAQRSARVAAGLDELDQWLCDRIRTGLADLERSGYAEFESVAARMVDAQAPGVAGRLRRMGGVLASGEGWPARLLAEFALLRLLVRAHRRLDDLAPALAAAVRAHVGYPVTKESVLASKPVRDTWAVLSLHDTVEDRLTARRVWLRGTTGRPALVLSYTPSGQAGGEGLDGSLVPGTSIDADLHYYPSGRRVLVGARRGEPGLLGHPPTTGPGGALAAYATALEADPWTGAWPVLLGRVTPVREGERWYLRDEAGAALPLVDVRRPPWQLLATSGGAPVTVAGEWAPGGLTPLSVVRGQGVVRL